MAAASRSQTWNLVTGDVGGQPGTAAMSRVWIVNHYAGAPDEPSGTRHFDLARQLQARGHTVIIFAAGFSNITYSDERRRGRLLYRTQSVDGVRFVWLWTFPYRGNGWRRAVNMLSYVATLLAVQTRLPRPDTVVGSTVHPFAAFGAWMVARLRRARFLFEIRDLWPQTLVDLGAMRDGSLGERLLRSMEAFLVGHASAVVTLLPGMRDYLAGRGLPTGHVVYIPNGVDVAAVEPLALAGPGIPAPVARVKEIVGAKRGEGRFVIAYVGAYGRVNRLDVLVKAATIAEARSPGRISLVMVGDGAERERLAEMAVGGSAVVGPAVPKRYVPSVLALVDAAVVHATATPVYRYGVSFNKLFDYMAAGLPVVFACESAYDPVAAVGAGVSVPPDDPEGIAEAFLRLADATDGDRARMGAAGRDYVRREHSIDRLGGLLEAVVRSGRPPADA